MAEAGGPGAGGGGTPSAGGGGGCCCGGGGSANTFKVTRHCGSTGWVGRVHLMESNRKDFFFSFLGQDFAM